MLLAQPVGHVGDREVGRHQGLRVDLDQDLADVAPLDGDVGDVRDAADPGPQVVVGVVVQRRRIAAAGDDERDDREDRGGLPLGDRGRAGRELGADLGHPGADVVERLDHVGARARSRSTSSAAPRTDFDRTRMTPRTMLDRLLDRPGDGDLDVLDRQAGRLGDDHDPREGDLGIDAAGHAEHRHDAEGRQQTRGQDDQPEVRPGQGDEVDPAAGRSSSGSRFPAPRVRLMGGLRLRVRHRPWLPAV